MTITKPLGNSMTQSVALEVLNTGRNAFITGPPGAGKSYLLRQFVTAARKKQSVSVTASTGVAATQVGGTTLHSWAGLGVRDSYSSKDIATIADNNRVANRIRSTDVLVIDEVSMLHVATFQAAEAVCRKVKRNSQPFGGMQIVLCGDFFQLPPVSKEGKTEFIYRSAAWDELALSVLYLSEQFRQSDDHLLSILTAIRNADVTADHFEKLQQRMNALLDEGIVPTRLHTHNIDVDRVNNVELNKLTGDVETFEMTSNGPEAVVNGLRNSCLAPAVLSLKKDSAVMFVKNNLAEGYVNGTLGKVVGFKDSCPSVVTNNGVEILAEPQEWVAEDAKGKKIASVKQTPLRLAWALSIHKSQGMSLSAAEIDLSRAFVEGLGYVALSRVSTLDGIRLLGLNKHALRVSERAAEIDRELQAASDEVLAGGVPAAPADSSPPPAEAMTLF